MASPEISRQRLGKLIVLVLLIFAIVYLDFRLGFGFNLFPLFLLPMAVIAWTETLPVTAAFSLAAGTFIILKAFITKELYAHRFFWYWDGFVKFALLQLFSNGLWRIRQLTLQQRQQDAAKIRELNASLQAQVKQLTAANRELAEVSYTISHDLRAPLRHIVGFVALLGSRSHEVLDEKSRHYLQVISQSTQKMGDLVDGLLAFSQLGRTELLKGRVELGSVVQSVRHSLAQETGTRDIVWHLGVLPAVFGDAALLRQVMYNLIGNAVKFTKSRPQAVIEIGTVDAAGETQVYVRDNGAGFDMRYVGKLFGMFQRLHVGEEFEGTGVGLAIARRIVERHGGRIWADGNLDAGATFWFSLPKEQEPPAGWAAGKNASHVL